MGDDKDLTRIEDLSEYLHEDDPEVDKQLTETSAKHDVGKNTIGTDIPVLDELQEESTEEDAGTASEETFEATAEEESFEAPTEEEAFEAPAEEETFEASDSGETFESTTDEGEFDGATEEESFEASSEESFEEPTTDEGFQTVDEGTFDSQAQEDTFETAEETTEFTEGESFEPASEEQTFDGEIRDEDATETIAATATMETPKKSVTEHTEQTDRLPSLLDSQTGVKEASEEEPPSVSGIAQTTQTTTTAPAATMTQIPSYDKTSSFTAGPAPVDDVPASPTTPVEQDKFAEVKQFAKSISYGPVTAAGNPPYSLILKNIKFKEDADDILRVLREYKLATTENESTIQQSLMAGSLLISQISEYSAIFLAHQFRHLDLEIMVGLSEELRPSTSYDSEYRGLITKENIKQNKSESMDFRDIPIDISSIIVSTTPTIPNYKIEKYIDIISDHVVIDEFDLEKSLPSLKAQEDGPKGENHTQGQEEEGEAKDHYDEITLKSDLFNQMAEDDEDFAKFKMGLDDIYSDLINKLKKKALKLKGNAILGINFSMIPLTSTLKDNNIVKYKITCTGNVVWVSDI